MVVGTLNYKYLCDLLDRATSNRRFAVAEGVEGEGDDILGRGITPEARHTMPFVPPGSIVRSDYQGSPGWAADGYRVLLQSFKYGEIDHINWGQRSDAKRRVASQSYVSQDTLFSIEEIGLEPLVATCDADDFVGTTLVAAHSYDAITGKFELYIGQSKNPEFPGDVCWHWRHQLLNGGTSPLPTGQTLPPILPGDAPSAQAEEIDIRLKKSQSDDGAVDSNG
ncbi:hypothetical protein SAMN05421776_10322 [Nocardia farcinica]|uniref:Uncharacterized protein n=2 Tax=Nocardia farcinica TaxID=37329 RepID=A0A0H5NXZ1_NOCFR|nr:hypothetical protein CJ469_06373 [Nocardia farcinica]PFW99192.1 hypothetical protein CJ468_06397 [Nocardia farcinica]CRY80545.1 Uncharacterised protein [Nocardia farcinica]SIT06436.1 hypothetical protein SAMN05421776_10322 [Nocardia farcinica]